MNPGLMKPPAIDAPKMPQQGMGDDAQYTGSDQRCAQCANFDGGDQCSLGVNGGTVEPMGHCNKFEGGEPNEGINGDESAGSIGGDPQAGYRAR
jgi:hypothetical protein